MFSCFLTSPRARRVSPWLTGVICGLAVATALGSSGAQADEFSLVPSGDPMYRQLDALSASSNDKTPHQNLTRYEMALQTARIITNANHSSQALTSRADWRALRELTQSLRPELVRLGIDVTATLALCDKNATSPLAASLARPAAPASAAAGIAPSAPTSFASALGAGSRSSGLLNSELSDGKVSKGSVELPISQRLRADGAVLTTQRPSTDPFAASGAAPGSSLDTIGNNTSLTYDFNSWLSVRALASNRELNGPGSDSPLLDAPLFAGASAARSAGGGVDLNLGNSLKLSTEVERLQTNNGLSGTRIGGGLGLSAWQNRLSLSARLSRLLPEDNAALSSTAAELNLGVDVNDRLSLGLQYQNLFTPDSTTNTSRVSGGLSVNF